MDSLLLGPADSAVESPSKPHEGTAQYPGGQKAWIAAALVNDVVNVVVGRDVGKSVSMLFLVEEESSRCTHHYDAAYVAQTHSEARQRYLEWLARWEAAGLVVDKFDKDQDRWIELRPWGRNKGWRVYFWSGTEKALDGLRGKRLDRLLVDEAGQIPEKIKKVCYPMMLSRGGKVLNAGTPSRKGPGYAWFKDSYLRGKKRLPGFVSFNAPSECSPFNCPPYKAPDYMERRRQAFRSILEPDVKTVEEREEFDGEFIDDLGVVFCNIDAVCSLPVIRIEHGTLYVGADPIPGEKYLIGQDWGRVKDASVSTVYNRHSREQVALRVEPIGGQDYDRQLERLDSLHRRYNAALIVGDGRDAGNYLGPHLRKKYGDAYVNIMLAASGDYEKGALVTRMRRLFQGVEWKMLDVPAQKEQFADFQAYVPETTGDGVVSSTIKYGAPKGKHDDIVMSNLFASIRLETDVRRSTPRARYTSPFSFEGIQAALARKRRLSGGVFRLR